MLYGSLRDGFAETSAGRLHYKERAGGRQTVVFIHGFGASTRSFERLVELLPKELGICLLDLLGHGDSDAPRMEYSVALQARLVREFLEEKKLSSYFLFGHSYGGWVAASVAQGNYKGDGLILEDSPGLEEQMEEIIKTGKVEEYKEELLKEALLTNPREHVLRSSLDFDMRGAYLTKESLASIVKPTLVIWGSDDGTIPVRYARLFNEYIKGSVLEIVQGAGHVAHYTHAQIVKSLLLEFIGYRKAQ